MPRTSSGDPPPRREQQQHFQRPTSRTGPYDEPRPTLDDFTIGGQDGSRGGSGSGSGSGEALSPAGDAIASRCCLRRSARVHVNIGAGLQSACFRWHLLSPAPRRRRRWLVAHTHTGSCGHL
jgi:hypothetical protein